MSLGRRNLVRELAGDLAGDLAPARYLSLGSCLALDSSLDLASFEALIETWQLRLDLRLE